MSVINAAYFSDVTGLLNPPFPVTAQTYLELGLPWFALYDEQIPLADNTSSPTPLTDVQSIAQIDAARASTGGGSCQAEWGIVHMRWQPSPWYPADMNSVTLVRLQPPARNAVGG